MKPAAIAALALPAAHNISEGISGVFNASRNATLVCFGSQGNVSIGNLTSLNETRAIRNASCVVLPTLTETPSPSFVTVTRTTTRKDTPRIRTLTPTRSQPTVTETVTETATPSATAEAKKKKSIDWGVELLAGGSGAIGGAVAGVGTALVLKGVTKGTRRQTVDKYTPLVVLGFGVGGVVLGAGIGIVAEE